MLTTWGTVSTLDRMLDDVMGSAFGTATHSRTFEPAIDVRTSENEVLFVCDVPGVKAEELDITLENHVLTIRGARKFESNAQERVMLGRTYGSFKRSFTLADTFDEENLSASVTDGVLTVRVPRLAKAKPRRIPIGRGSEGNQLKG